MTDDHLHERLERFKSDTTRDLFTPPLATLRQRARRQSRRRLAVGWTATAVACAAVVAAGAFLSRDADIRSHPAPAVSPTRSAEPTPSSNQPTLKQIVRNPKSTLYAVDVRPGPDGYNVAAWWALRRGNKVYEAIATSDDRFESAGYQRGSWTRWAKRQPPAKKVPGPAIAAFKGLITSPVESLAPGIRAFVGGGDGATLLPFQAVARSRQGGPWQAYVVPQTHGDQAYDEGDLVLPDGRFLVLINAWSSDRGPTKPGPEYHGLWVSAGEDWAKYTPYHPSFSPALGPSDQVASIQAEPGASRQAPHGFVVATTRENRVYVSTDGAQTFQEIRAR